MFGAPFRCQNNAGGLWLFHRGGLRQRRIGFLCERFTKVGATVGKRQPLISASSFRGRGTGADGLHLSNLGLRFAFRPTVSKTRGHHYGTRRATLVTSRERPQ